MDFRWTTTSRTPVVQEITSIQQIPLYPYAAYTPRIANDFGAGYDEVQSANSLKRGICWNYS